MARQDDLTKGEQYAELARLYGKLAAECLFRGQWTYETPEWFDHRLHLLDPVKHFNDFWTASADNVISVMPLDGTLLDLCCGDGFYDYHFYRHRCSLIVAVDNNSDALGYARQFHSDPVITYVEANVLQLDTTDMYDTILIRGAIEHFEESTQQYLFQFAHDHLKPGGWFCGDTPAKRVGPGMPDKMLDAHEHEWADEGEMITALKQSVFTASRCRTRTLVCRNRTTLFWKCQK